MKYQINIPNKKPAAPKMILPPNKYTANSNHFIKNGKPWIPIMGEFHYSRYPKKEWERELWKIKSGGIEVIATYVIWIHHEEIKNEWDFENEKDLRYFIELCKKLNLSFFLRVGPFAHGEVRNGGLPDWLIKEVSNVRSNDETYQTYTKLFFEKIYQQVEGLFEHQGGPIIGIQVENEYGHVGGDNGPFGIAHMRWLHQTLKQIGFSVPYYTATGWGGAIWVDDMLPVFGGYVEAPWEQTTESLALSENFLISPQRDDGSIASDHKKQSELAIKDLEHYPYMTAELGGGVQVTHHRRPLIDGVDVARQAFSMFASGANLLGYYMYHGGTNPKGKLSTLQESKDTGYLNDLPVLSYDFQAPLGEFGTFHNSYKLLRRLHQFIKSFENELAEAITIFPENIITDPKSDELRMSVRHNYSIGGGFLFISNYQRKSIRKSFKDIEIELKIGDELIKIPNFSMKKDEVKIIPYNLPVMNSKIISTNAELVNICKNTLVFAYDDQETPTIIFDGKTPEYIVLTNDEINNGLFVDENLLISENIIWEEDEKLFIVAHKDEEITVIPSNQKIKVRNTKNSANVKLIKTSDGDIQSYELQLDYISQSDFHYLEIDFEADRAELWTNGRLIADHFMIDRKWQLLMERFDKPNIVELKIFKPTEKVFYDIPVNPDNMKIYSIKLKSVNLLGIKL